jgi:hypothetical protein
MKTKRIAISQTACLALLLFIIGGSALAQEPQLKINYRLAMSHPNSHLFEVGIEVETPPETKLDRLDFQMPRWSPGRYAVFDFAQNVQEFNAVGGCPLTEVYYYLQSIRQRSLRYFLSARFATRKLQRRLHLHVRRQSQAGSSHARY